MNETAARPTEWWRAEPPAPPLIGANPFATVRRGGAFPFWCMVAFTFVMLLAPQIIFPALIPLRLAFWTGMVAILSYLVSRLMGGGPLTVVTPEVTTLGVLAAWAVATVPFSLWPGGSLQFIQDYYLKALVVFWLLANTVSSPRRYRTISWALTLMSVPIAAVAIRNFIRGDFIEDLFSQQVVLQRVEGYESGLTANPNDLALMLNLILPLMVGLFLGDRRPTRRLVLLLTVALAVVAIVVTFSRAGFLTLATIAVAFLWKLRRHPERKWVYAALVVALACVPLLPGGYLARLSTIADPDADLTTSAQARRDNMIAAAGFIAKHPLFGAGIGNGEEALHEERAGWALVHSVYFQYALELGLPGAILFVLVLGGLIRRLGRLQRALDGPRGSPEVLGLAQGAQVSLIAFAVAALFYPVAFNFYFYYIGGLAVALCSMPGMSSGSEPSAVPPGRAVR